MFACILALNTDLSVCVHSLSHNLACGFSLLVIFQIIDSYGTKCDHMTWGRGIAAGIHTYWWKKAQLLLQDAFWKDNKT